MGSGNVSRPTGARRAGLWIRRGERGRGALTVSFETATFGAITVQCRVQVIDSERTKIV
jgi:hypothetical protein